MAFIQCQEIYSVFGICHPYLTTFHEFFYIFSITILQKYMVRPKFCKTIHLPSWPTASET
jgi:hypothetical protein